MAIEIVDLPWFTHSKWWFSIVMLVYQGVNHPRKITGSAWNLRQFLLDDTYLISGHWWPAHIATINQVPHHHWLALVHNWKILHCQEVLVGVRPRWHQPETTSKHRNMTMKVDDKFHGFSMAVAFSTGNCRQWLPILESSRQVPVIPFTPV